MRVWSLASSFMDLRNSQMGQVSMYSKVIKARIIQSVFYIRVGDKKPMVDELQLCPTCQKAYLRPTGPRNGQGYPQIGHTFCMRLMTQIFISNIKEEYHDTV